MRYQYLKLNEPLTKYIWAALVFDSDSDTRCSDLPLFTNGMPTFLCKAKNDDYHITLFGQSAPSEAWAFEDSEAIIAFFFKPFVLGAAFKLSALQLKEKPVELNRWNAQKTIALKIQLHHSPSINEKVETLSKFILLQIEGNQRDCEAIRSATDVLMENSSAEALGQLLSDLSLTERTFQRIFKKYVGISANEYRRICQFYFAFSQLKKGHFNMLTDVAYSNGYFDQSHYIRSFKEFTGATPGEYLVSGINKADHDKFSHPKKSNP